MLIPSPVALEKTPSNYWTDEGVVGVLEHGAELPIDQGVLHLRVLLDQSLEHFPTRRNR
jgi:hypothetical protein